MNHAPESLRDVFEKWLIDNDICEEKYDAMQEIWDESDFDEIPSADASAEIEAIIAEAENRLRFNVRRRSGNALLWISSAAAVFFAFLSLALYFGDFNKDICYASSDDAKASFSLPDGSKVWLNRDSRLYFKKTFAGHLRKVRLEGEGFFDVTKNEHRPFVVHAGDVNLKVLGTEFTVTAYDPENISAYLQEGCIEADGKGFGAPLRLSPDQAMVFDKNENRYCRRPVRALNHTLWIHDKLIFENSTLFDITETLSHWYHIDLKCIDQKFAKNVKLSLTVRQEPADEILEAIKMLVPIECRFGRSGEIRISAK